MKKRVAIQLRMPPDAKDFIAAEAERNASSQNSEIIRCIRERMERLARERSEVAT
jgi:hypothetical protein